MLAGKSGRELLQLMRANGPVPQADMDLARECYDWAATFNALSQAGGADVLELGSNPKLNSPAFAVAEAVLAVAEVAAHHIHGMAGGLGGCVRGRVHGGMVVMEVWLWMLLFECLQRADVHASTPDASLPLVRFLCVHRRPQAAECCAGSAAAATGQHGAG